MGRDRHLVTATIIGVPAPGVAVWRAVDDPEIVGDLDDPDELLRPDDHVVLDVARDRFRWLVVELVEIVPRARGRGTGARRRRPHAHPARPPGTVLIAWLPFTRDDTEGPGKHRPCVVVHSSDPAVIRARPLYDPNSAFAKREGGVAVQDWRSAGLDKASVATEPVEIPVGRCEQTMGMLSPADLHRLGIARRRQR